MKINQLSMSVGYLLKYFFYVNQQRHCQMLAFTFVDQFHPEAIKIFLCIHRGFTFSKTNKPKIKESFSYPLSQIQG